MAVSISLPPPWKKRGWKVKIRDRERVEPPHVTVMRGVRSWRWGLRERAFLDAQPDPSEVPDEVVSHLQRQDVHDACVIAWDRMYPSNPVAPTDDVD